MIGRTGPRLNPLVNFDSHSRALTVIALPCGGSKPDGGWAVARSVVTHNPPVWQLTDPLSSDLEIVEPSADPDELALIACWGERITAVPMPPGHAVLLGRGAP